MENYFTLFSTPLMFSLLFTLIALVGAYILYRVFLFVLKRFGRKKELGKHLTEQIRYPILSILLELALALSLPLFRLPEKWRQIGEHTLMIVVIATVGWLIAGIVRACFRNFCAHAQVSEKADQQQRSLFTQILFLYRLMMFVILAITAAAILMTFPYIKSLGVGILGSAGIAGIALGMAARPILLNLMSGFQIALTKTVKIGDNLMVEGEAVRVESIHLTHAILRTWDLRRMILPISYLIDKPFENWDATSGELLAVVFLYCDYTVPVDALRQKTEEVLETCPHWNKRVWSVQVNNCTEKSVEIRIFASAKDANTASDLKAYLREALIDFLQKNYPSAFPHTRNYEYVKN